MSKNKADLLISRLETLDRSGQLLSVLATFETMPIEAAVAHCTAAIAIREADEIDHLYTDLGGEG